MSHMCRKLLSDTYGPQDYASPSLLQKSVSVRVAGVGSPRPRPTPMAHTVPLRIPLSRDWTLSCAIHEPMSSIEILCILQWKA